jgi:Fungal specific transcription factor domain
MIDEGIKFVIHTPGPVPTYPNGSQQRFGSRRHQTSNTSPTESPNTEREHYSGQPLEMLVSSDPRSALNNPDISGVFRHYIDCLAPWYDLCDADNSFGTIVPLHALDNPILFKALIAFSAYHKSRISGKVQGLGYGFHAACVQDLLRVIDNFQLGLQGDYLAATCLLRSYEILSGIV